MAISNVSGIYAIRHVASGRIYIGSASVIRLRFHRHRYDLKRGLHHSRFLQRAWNKHGERAFVFEVLEHVADVKLLTIREQHWIDTHKASSKRIYNVSPVAGTTLGLRHSEEARAKMKAFHSTPEARAANSARQLGTKPSPETLAKHRATIATAEFRARMSAALTGRKATPEAIEANRRGQTGRKHTEETKAKMRANSTGKRHSPETRAKISAVKTGHKIGPFTAAHRAKIGAARTGIPMSEATKAKIRAKALLRPPKSAETRAKISAATKGRPHTPEHTLAVTLAKRRQREIRRLSFQPELPLPRHQGGMSDTV